MTDTAIGEHAAFLWNLPARSGERRLAAAIVAASALIFLILVPFAKQQLGPLPAFIPIYQSALLINDLITAVFLLGQCQLSQSRALGLLAGGYLFTALMSAVHALTFPGLFVPAG
jgi:two-component system, sensor histidine kinase and response regulator